MQTYPRISARLGNVVELDVSFIRGGMLADPYAICKVDIYRSQVAPHNLIGTFPVVSPCDPTYPSPVTKLVQDATSCDKQDVTSCIPLDKFVTFDMPNSHCTTHEYESTPSVGKYALYWDVPNDIPAPDAYFDVWTFLPMNPCSLSDYASLAPCANPSEVTCGMPDPNNPVFAPLLIQLCNRFWIYPEFWNAQDNLSTIKIGFEPLDQKFQQPEVRPLEIGLMPLPLYDYDFNLVAPVIPLLQGSITIETFHKEVLVANQPMTMGLRQGSYRTNPYVLKYLLDTTKFLIGTYAYRVQIALPDGTTRVSPKFNFTIS